MSNLHAYFALRNQQGFSKALDGSRYQTNSSGSALSSSGSKSWTRSSSLSSLPPIDVNAKDWLGRTVLHLACAVTDHSATAFVQLLLAHPNINVNIQDTESRWTALHRALYAGNIAACQQLLQRSDVDFQIRDNEGFTAFDLYNSTIEGTRLRVQPPSDMESLCNQDGCDLLTWGGNRNATLGHGDGDDRTYPDHVVIKKLDPIESSSSAKFIPIHVKGINMAKLHTVIITDERHGNLRLCGFGSGGRLGPGQHTQYSLMPVAQFTHCVVAAASGQDHTLVLTSDGEVLSWGLNRFSQLGYVVESVVPTGSSHSRAMEEPIQAIARKVLGPLKKEIVIGVAACKVASACWTKNDVFTWGTNNGHLGYDKAAQPVQILPRKVTGVQTVTDLAMTDSAMICLLNTKDVMCFTNDSRFRVKFPIYELSEFPRYVHPFVVKPPIAKITSCDGVFGALSSRGDVYTFAVPQSVTESTTNKGARVVVRPQRVWSLRNSSAARDIALGSDGEIILGTESGHVYIRSRSSRGGIGGKTLKFHRVPFIHRVVKVCANSTGAFAALRFNYAPKPVLVSGPSLMDDLRSVRPWLSFELESPSVPTLPLDDQEDEALATDIIDTTRLCAILTAENVAHKTPGRALFQGPVHVAHGADIVIEAGCDILAHRVILAARSTPLRDLLEGSCAVLKDATVTIKHHHGNGTGLSRLLVTDDIPAIWDRRVAVPCSDIFMGLKINPAQVNTEVESMSRILNLSALSAALLATAKRVPSPTLRADMACLFHDISDCYPSSSALKPDVFLELADRNVACHSLILRARCPFFRSFFDDQDWTIDRWSSERTLTVDMKHFECRAMSVTMAWLYTGNDLNLFDDLDSVHSIHDLLDLVFGVMAIASELLLDKLMLICSATVLRHVTLNNVTSILVDAAYYNALPLVESLQDYVANNLEAIMERHLLDGMPPDLIKSLSTFVSHRQAEKSPVMRSNLITETAMRKASTWLDLQDFPQPLIRSRRVAKDSPKLTPVTPEKTTLQRASPSTGSPLSSPLYPGTKASPPRSPKLSQGDDIFAMEDVNADTIPALSIGQPQPLPANCTIPGYAWKKKTELTNGLAKLDMKTIMAETAASKTTSTSCGASPSMEVPAALSGSNKWFQKPSQRQRRRMDVRPSDMLSPSVQRAASSESTWKLSAQRSCMAASSPIATYAPSLQSTCPVNVGGVPTASKPQRATPMSVFQASGTAPTQVPRRSHRDTPAWTNNIVQDLSPPAGLSFVAIQQQQRDEGQELKVKKGLREIQEEEQAKKAEENFLKWWTTQEILLKAEANMQSSPSGAESSVKRESHRRPGTRT